MLPDFFIQHSVLRAFFCLADDVQRNMSVGFLYECDCLQLPTDGPAALNA